MMIQKNTPTVNYNWGLKRLNIQLNETTNQILLVQNVVIPKNKKTLF